MPMFTRGKEISQGVILHTISKVLVAAEAVGVPDDVIDHQRIYIARLTREVLTMLNIAFDVDGVLAGLVEQD